MQIFKDPTTAEQFHTHESIWNQCVKCPYAAWAQHHVFFRGTIPCDILFIGEAPGRTENRVGYPFVGAAGDVFSFWVKEATRQIPFDWAVTNIVVCRPCASMRAPNEQPKWQEQENCFERLLDFVENIAKPKGVILMGRVAHQSIFASSTKLPKAEIFHPAFVVYNGGIERSRYAHTEVEKILKFIRRVGR